MNLIGANGGLLFSNYKDCTEPPAGVVSAVLLFLRERKMNAKKAKRIRKVVGGVPTNEERSYDFNRARQALTTGKRKEYRLRKKALKVLARKKSFKEKIAKNVKDSK
jgi:hypothetical protein